MAEIYLNEWDAFPAGWLRNQFLDAVVDETSIVALNRPPEEFGPYPWGVPVDHDLSRYEQVHFFAGIGGWPEALRLAAWPEGVPIWTGSCPCQPFSGAGEGRGFDDERDLWPDMFRQIQRHRPGFVVGEQVANGRDQLPLRWLDRVYDDLQAEGYTCWTCDLPAACAGAPIIRQRLFWGAVRRDQIGVWSRESGDLHVASGERWNAGRTDHGEHDRNQPDAADGDLSGSDRERCGSAEGPTGEERSCSRSESGRQLPVRPEGFGTDGDLPGSAGARLQGREDSRAGCSGEGKDIGGLQQLERSGSDVERSSSDGRQPRRSPADGGIASSGCGSSHQPTAIRHVPELGQPDGKRSSELSDLRRGLREADGSGSEVRSSSTGHAQRTGVGAIQSAARRTDSREAVDLPGDSGGCLDGSEHSGCSGRDSHRSGTSAVLPSGQGGFWDQWELCHFTDGKVRRIEPGTVPLAHGIPTGNRWAIPRLGELGIDSDTAKRIVALARSNRVGTLRGYGNAICPEAAAIFVRVWMDELGLKGVA